MSRRYFPIRQTFKHDATPTNTGPQRLGSPFSQARAEVGKGLKRAKICLDFGHILIWEVNFFGHLHFVLASILSPLLTCWGHIPYLGLLT